MIKNHTANSYYKVSVLIFQLKKGRNGKIIIYFVQKEKNYFFLQHFLLLKSVICVKGNKQSSIAVERRKK